MKTDPQKEHQWLQRIVGEWSYAGECEIGPGQPPAKIAGSERVRSLGGLWIIAEGQGEMPGCGAATTLMTLGFDPGRRRFVGTWVGSMMTHLWIYDGALDGSGRVLTLESEGPDFGGEGKMAKYQDVITIDGNDRRVLTSRTLGADGQWHQFMSASYRRNQP